MAFTYDFLPVSVPTFLREITARVSENLKYELNDSVNGLTTKFKHGSWMEIERQLLEDSQDKTKRNDKYPLIIAIHPITELVHQDRNLNEVSLDVLIVVDSDVNKSIDDREEESFKAILYKIYAEFLEQLWASPQITDTGYRREHTKKDLYHLGQESASGMQKYKLPDAMDGLAMLNLKFSLNLAHSYTEQSTGCNDTVCTNGRMIELLDIITSVDFEVNEDGNIRGIINSATLTNNSSIQTPVTYFIDDGNGGGQFVNIGDWFFIDVSAFADSTYTGAVISSYGATAQFAYKVQHGIKKWTTGIRMALNPTYDCAYFPNYVASFDSSYQFNSFAVSSWYFQQDEIALDSNLAASGSTVHVLGAASIDNSIHSFQSLIALENNSIDLLSSAIIKLKCIS